MNATPPSREIVYEKLTRIFRNVLQNDSLVLNDQLAAPDVPGWDSFSHIHIIVTAEQEFGISFNAGEIIDLANVGQLIDVILRKKSQTPS